MSAHKLSSSIPAHRVFLGERRTDRRTGKFFEEGDTIVFCASKGCGSAHLVDSWNTRGGCSACKGRSILREFPVPQTIKIGKGPKGRKRARTFVIKTPVPQAVGEVDQPQVSPRSQSADYGCAIAVIVGVILVLILVSAIRSCVPSAPTKTSAVERKEPAYGTAPTSAHLTTVAPSWRSSPITRDSSVVARSNPEPSPANTNSSVANQEDSDWNAMLRSLREHARKEAATATLHSVSTPWPTEPTATLEPTTPPIPVMCRVVNVRMDDYLNVRQGPGSDYPIVARLPPSFADIQREERRYANGETIWQEISIAGQRGYVNEIYLELVP